MKISLPWRESEIELALPGDWRVIAEARPRDFPACASVEDEFARAMAQPIGASPLAGRDLSGKRIVLVVDDFTRPTPAHLFLPYLLRQLEGAGAEPENLLLLSALGVHRRMTDAEMERKVGRDVLARLRWENHDARDVEGVVCLGTTSARTEVYINRHLAEADLIISVGSIEPHVLAGFGGGLKNLVPGCAGIETIAHNHLCGTTGKEAAQIGSEPEANPLRRDLEDSAGMLRAEIFLVNTVLNARQEIVRIFTGDARGAHREGVRLAREIYGVEVPEPADIVITDSAPMDTDLRQCSKCIGNTLAAAKERGIILALLACREGVGDFKMSGSAMPRPLLKAWLRRMSREKMVKFLDRFRRDLPLEEKFLAFYALQILRRNDVLAYAPAITRREAKRLGFFRRVEDPAELIRRARRHAPRHATVAIFPQGGVTFPILARSA